MDRSSYREPTARGSPAGSIISTSSQGTKRRRTTYNTPIPIEYRNQFLRTPDTAFSPPASQNGKSEQPLFGSSTNRTLFNSPSRNPTSTTTTAFPQIPSRQSPIALQTSPPLSSSFRGPTRRPVRPVNPHNRSNLSSIGPRRGGSIAGSINGNSVRPSPSLGMAASSVSRAPGSTRSSVASGSLRGSASNYTASSYSRPLPSAEDLKKRADPLIGFLGQSIQRAKGALTESKEAEKEAQRIKEREEIRKSKEEEERRRRDEIFQQIMEEEAERERQEMLEQARALRHTQRTEAAEGEVQTYTPVDSQPAVQTSQGMGVLQSAKEEGPQEQATSMGQPVLSSAASIQTPSIIAKSTAPEIPASESSEESEESGAEDTPICREEASDAVHAHVQANKGDYLSDEEFSDDSDGLDEEEPGTSIPGGTYQLNKQSQKETEDYSESSDDDGLEYSDEEDGRDRHIDVQYDGFEDEDELLYSEDEEDKGMGEAPPQPPPKNIDSAVIEILDDDSEEEQSEVSVEEDTTASRAPFRPNFTRRPIKAEQEEKYEERIGEGDGGEAESSGEELDEEDDEADAYSTEDEESEGEQMVEHRVAYEHGIGQDMMDLDETEAQQVTSADNIVDLQDDDDMVEITEAGTSDPIVRMASAIAPLSEHVAAYEDMDISLDFSDTETQTADKAEKENTFQKDEVFTVTDAASTMEASGQKDESSTSANLEREISEAPTPRFPSGAHVWRTVSDDEPSTSTGEKARMDGGVDPSFIDIMSKSNGPVTMDHPSVPTPTERLKIVDDDAEDNTNVDTNLQDQMEILDDDHKPAYESEKDGYTEQEDTPSIASHPIDINDVCGAHLVGDNQALSESGYVQDFSLLEKSAASEEKSIEDLLAEKQEQFNQEMRASDIAGNMEPFIQEEAQAAFVFRDVSPPSLGAEPNYDDLDTNKGPRTEPAPISHEAESSSRYSKAAREISEIPSKDPQSTANGPREQLAESTARLPEEASPMAEKYNTTQLETVALTREPSLMPEVRESATAEPIVLDEQETAEDALRKKRHPTVEEVIDDADIKFLSEKVAPVPDHENAQSHESAEATSEIAHYPEPTNDEAPDDANVVLNATHSSKAEDTAMAEANDTSEPPAESDLALEQNAVQAERSSYDNEKTELQEEKELDREVEEGKEVEDPMAGSMHVNGTTTTSIRITTTQIAYRAVIDEDVPTTVLSVKAFDAEVLETTGPTDFQLPPAPEFHMPDPGPFEVEDKEDDLESVDVGWNGPDSPTTGTTEIYIRETKEEEQSAFDVEILRDEEAPASEDEAEKFADADDAEASNSGEVSEEYVDAEEDDLEEKEVFADAEGIADAEEAEQFTDASEEASGDEEEQGSVYEDQPETADEDETTAKQTKSTPKKTAHRATTEEDTRETSVESGRDEDEEFLSINVDLARAEPLGPKTASSTHDKEAELVTPTRSTFAVVIESPTGPPKRRASVASHVEIDATPSVVIGEHISPQPKKRKRESEEPEEKAQQKSTKVAGGSPSRAKTDIVEIEQDAEHEVEEEMEQEPAEDDELEQHQKDIVNDVFDNDNDAAEFPASTDEGMELRDGKVLPPATSEKSDGPTEVVASDSHAEEGLKMELRDGKVVGGDEEPTTSKEAKKEKKTDQRAQEEGKDGDMEEESEDAVKLEVPEHTSPSRGMELRDGKVIAATPSRETSMEPREGQGMSLRRGKVLATPSNKRESSAARSMSPPFPIGVSTGEEIVPKSQKGRRSSKAKTPVPATPVRRSTRRVSPGPPTASQVLSPLPEAEEANVAETHDEIVVKSAKPKRTSKKRSVAEVSTDELVPPSVKEGTRGGKRAKTVSRGPSVDPEEGGLKSRLRRKA